MAKYIVEYKLQAGHIPYFIEDGGYYLDTGKMVGVTKDDVDCYIPKLTSDGGDLDDFTNQQFIDKVKAMTLYDSEGTELTTQQKEDQANAWLTDKGFI